MRIAIRLAGIVVALVAVLLVGLAVALPRLVRSEAARARIEGAAREATGREVRYQDLDFALLPPRLVVQSPAVLGESSGAPAVFEADAVELEIALAPLLAWTVVVDSLQIEGATVRLVRTRDGVELPLAKREKPASARGEAAPRGARQGEVRRGGQAPQPASSEPEKKADDETSGLALAVRRVNLEDCRVILEDRTLPKPVTWEIRDVRAEAIGESLKAPIDFNLDGTLASGGSLRAKGQAELEGAFRVELRLDDVVLAPAAPYLEKGQRVLGAVSGTVSSSGSDAQIERVSVDLVLRDGEVALDDLSVRGQMKVRADIDGGLANAKGTFQLDATEAELTYGELLRKGRGTAATATGRIETGSDGHIVIRDTQVKMRNFEAEVQVETGARTRSTLNAEPFDLAGWEALIPALEEYTPAGRVGLSDLRVATAPLELRGDVDLQALRLRRPDGTEVVLNGVLRGTGGGMRSENLVARLAGQEIRLAVDVADLAGRPRFDTQVEADDADSAALLALVSERKDTLQGPLDLRASLQGPLGGDRPLTDTLGGTVRFSIEPGRMKNVSLLEQVFKQMGGLGSAALLAGQLKGDGKMQRYYEDEFQYLGGTLRIAGGLARTDDLRLVYRNYTVDLRGAVGLTDQRLDLRGELTIDEEIDATIASPETPAPETRGGRSRVIPLARVTGTLAAPRVELTQEAMLHFAGAYTTGERREKWERQIDERLGEGAGRQAMDILDELLKGKPQEPRR